MKSNIELVVGSACHRGFEELLSLIAADQRSGWIAPMPVEDKIEHAVGVALGYFDAECTAHGLDVGAGDDPSVIYSEQRALVELLLRAWCEVELADFATRWEVVDVEREEELRLIQTEICKQCQGSGKWTLIESVICPWCGGKGETRPLIWMARADALLRSRDTDHDYYVLSIKTKGWNKYDSRTADDNRIDMQGMSELAAIEGRLEAEWAAQVAKNVSQGSGSQENVMPARHAAPKVMGIQYLYLLKGARRAQYNAETQDYSGPRKQQTPLLYPYFMQGIVVSGDTFKLHKKYQCTAPHPIGAAPKTARGKQRMCEGWRNHLLPDVWTEVPVWEMFSQESGGLRDWIRMLATDEVEGGRALLESLFPQLDPIYRDESQVRAWRRQMISQELDVVRRAAEVNALPVRSDEWWEALDRNFVQATRSCIWGASGRKCQYFSICHSGLGTVDPVGTGLYEYRVPNHQAEKERINGSTGA